MRGEGKSAGFPCKTGMQGTQNPRLHGRLREGSRYMRKEIRV